MDEARVLTPDEIRRLPRTSIVWIEFYNFEEGVAMTLIPSMKCRDGSLVDEETCVYDDFENDQAVQPDGYWRFWSAEPTKEQREKTRWPHEQC